MAIESFRVDCRTNGGCFPTRMLGIACAPSLVSVSIAWFRASARGDTHSSDSTGRRLFTPDELFPFASGAVASLTYCRLALH